MSDAAPPPTPRPAPSAFDTAVDRFAAWTLGVVSSITLFGMMVLAFIDVWGRYLLRQPVFGGYEVTEFMMGVLIFSALPVLCAREGHVTIDILDNVTSPRFGRWQRFVVNLISAVVLVAMTWLLFRHSAELAVNNEVTMTLKVPHAPFAYAFAVMAAIAALACLATTLSYALGWRSPAQSLS